MMLVLIPFIRRHLPNLLGALGPADSGTRPRRAEARERGAEAPSLSRPAAIPPAHVVARAALAFAIFGMAAARGFDWVACHNAARHPGSCVLGTKETKNAREARANGIEEAGCKIKGGLARVRQALEPVGAFNPYAYGRWGRGLATRAQALKGVGDFWYPAHLLAKNLEEFA